MDVFQRSSLNSSHPLFPPLCPQVPSLHLCFDSCPAIRFLVSFFKIPYIYIYIYIYIYALIYYIGFSLSELLHSVYQAPGSFTYFQQSVLEEKNLKHTWEVEPGATPDTVLSLDWGQGEGTDKGSVFEHFRCSDSASRLNYCQLTIRARQLTVSVSTGFQHSKLFLGFGNHNVVKGSNIKIMPCLKRLWSKVYYCQGKGI